MGGTTDHSDLTLEAIYDFVESQSARNSQFKYAIGLAATSHYHESTYFSFPRIIEEWGFYLHVVCSENSQALALVKALQDLVHVFFIDCEDKTPKFSAHLIRASLSSHSFRPIYPNHLTSLAALDFVEIAGARRILIVGHGDIAHKIASLLSQRGKTFYWEASRSSRSTKYMKMLASFSENRNDDDSVDIDLVINCSAKLSQKPRRVILAHRCKVLDVASKGTVKASTGQDVENIDVSARLTNEVSFQLRGNAYSENRGRTTADNGRSYISGGFLGKSGDLVVDNHRNPTYVIGVSNGQGGFRDRVNRAFNPDKNPAEDGILNTENNKNRGQ